MPLLMGRRPAKHTEHSTRSRYAMASVLDPLGAPPDASNDWTAAVTVDWGMMLNDQLGCCVCADTGHELMLRTANVGAIIVPTEDDIKQLYKTVGHYVDGDASTDNGCVELDMCDYLVSNGFLGHKADATASVSPHNLDHQRWSIQLYGGVRYGFNMPQSAMDQFNAGQPWDDVGDYNIVGGHDVPGVVYHNGLIYAVTWGRLHPVTPAFIAAYCEEAHCELFFDWIAAQGVSPSGFDLADLASKMRALS